MAALQTLTARAHQALLALALLMALLAGLALAAGAAGIFSVSAPADPGGAAWAPAAPTAPATDTFEAHQLIIGLRSGTSAAAALHYVNARTGLHATLSPQTSGAPNAALLQLPHNVTVRAAAARIKALISAAHPHAPGARAPVSYAVPNYIAKAAGRFVPDDPGRGKTPGGWQKLQWNFGPSAGVSAPGAWGNLIADGRAGASGVTIAVVDSGVAYENWHQYKRSPDFTGTKFVDPCDLVKGTIKDGKCTDTHASDAENHGTFVTSEIAESTNNHFGLTGLAYHATIMPVRVLDGQGAGSASAVAAGIRYAVNEGAQVINLSLEFDGVDQADIPGVIKALAYAHDKNVTVVGAAGNDGEAGLDYPAAYPTVISVAATSSDRCLAAYSDWGKGLTLVAPGGGDSASFKQKDCNPKKTLATIYQMTFHDPNDPGKFSLPGGWFGTSMAAPEVSAAAAMVIASGVIGTDPTPLQIKDRLEATAHPLDGSAPNKYYGYGLLNIDAATSPGGPTYPGQTTPTTPTST